MKKKIEITVFALLVLAAGILLQQRFRTPPFELKRQREDQILCYHDSSTIELYYQNPADSPAVEIRAELCVGDGPIELGRGTVRPGQTVTTVKTTDGKNCSHFVPDVYAGRILVYDLESGKLRERVEGLELRMYAFCRDSYDSLQPREPIEREIMLNETEYRPDLIKLRIDLKTEEIRCGLSGLNAEWRELDSYIYADIDGEDVLIAKGEKLPPRSVTFQLYLEPGVADFFQVGDPPRSAHVDSYYADTGELYDSITAEISEVVRTS